MRQSAFLDFRMAFKEVHSAEIEGVLGYVESEHVVESITMLRQQDSGTATPHHADAE